MSSAVPGALADPMSRRARLQRGGTFSVVVAAVTLLGAVLMAVVLLLSAAPGPLVVGTVLAALPVGPLLAAYTWLDRYEPEPRVLLVLGLGWGAFVATSSALVVQVAGELVLAAPGSLTAAVVAPVSEEAAKGLFVVLLLWFRRQEIDGVLDGIVYAGMVGIGFAFTENILYLSAAYVGDPGSTGPGGLAGAVGLFVVRGIFSPFAHPLFTAFTGIGVGLAVTSRRRGVRVAAPVVGLLLAMAAHAGWNGSLAIGGGAGFVLTYVVVMVPAFLLLVAFGVWARRSEGTLLTAALQDCARRGLLHPAEVPWLVRLPARRVARRHAHTAGGPAAGRAMREYQLLAAELGFLHHRFLRGSAPRDGQARGQTLVEAMAALRPALVWPVAGAATTVTPVTPPTHRGGRP
ncbi:membrane protein [Marmoricola endophyticus]|uniref:Membrane protein n=1 Tax=Marmoricola endophyticus TaxID=2040280 RepID=A0A917BT59_9ACTN|nr:PrsW family intramembrane metalloprotease [Marmoricola endophyticus]GGF57824.1 membrane protein [Marmoricola endophyticus]